MISRSSLWAFRVDEDERLTQIPGVLPHQMTSNDHDRAASSSLAVDQEFGVLKRVVADDPHGPIKGLGVVA